MVRTDIPLSEIVKPLSLRLFEPENIVVIVWFVWAEIRFGVNDDRNDILVHAERMQC